MSKWTKGPWEVCNGYDVFTGTGATSQSGVKADDNDGWHIADCMVGITFVDGQESSLSFDEQCANANLIAAAPELYEALSSSLALIKSNAIENPDCKFSQRLYVHAVDALTKARGE